MSLTQRSLCLAKVSLLNLGTSIRSTSRFPKCPPFETECWYVVQARQLLNLWQFFCLSVPPSRITDVSRYVCPKTHTLFYSLITTSVCVWGGMLTKVHMWRSESNFGESFLTFHLYVGCEVGPQVSRPI